VSGEVLTAPQDTWMRSHRWALLTTLCSDGRPQVSMVAFHWDGADAVISCRSTAAKWHNARRRPDVALTVADDRSYLAVAGLADCVGTDPDRATLTARLLDSLLPEDRSLLQADVDRGLDASRRVVIRVRPTGAVGRL